LSIAVTKEEKLTDAPMSPKMGPRQVWGRTASKGLAASGDDMVFRSPEDTKERINSKFQKLFGDPAQLTRSVTKECVSSEKSESSKQRRHSVH